MSNSDGVAALQDPPDEMANGELQPNTATKNKMYFQEYLNRKLLIQKRIDKKNSINSVKNSAQYINTIKLINQEPNIFKMCPSEILKGLKSLDKNISNDVIKSITQSRTKKVWYVQFNNNFDHKETIDRRLIINNKQFILMDANKKDETNTDSKVTLKAVLRVHWLTTNLQFERIKNQINELITDKHIDVIDISKETYKGDLEGIENGVINVKISIEVNHINELFNLIGINELCGQKALFQLCGHPPKCKYCESFEHQSKLCPRRGLKCSTCKGNYHKAAECNYAIRIKSRNIENQNSDDEDDEEDSNENTEMETETPILNPAIANNSDETESTQTKTNPVIDPTKTSKTTMKTSNNTDTNSNTRLVTIESHQKHVDIINSFKIKKASTPTLIVTTQTSQGIKNKRNNGDEDSSESLNEGNPKFYKKDEIIEQLTLEAHKLILIQPQLPTSTHSNVPSNKELKKLLIQQSKPLADSSNPTTSTHNSTYIKQNNKINKTKEPKT